MRIANVLALLLASVSLASSAGAQEGGPNEPSVADRPLDLSARQSPWGRWNIDRTGHDRVYSIGPSGPISVMDPWSDTFLGTVRLQAGSVGGGASQTTSIWAAQTFGYAPNSKSLAVVSAQSRSVMFVDTRSNSVIHVASFEASPAGVAYAPNGREVWIPIPGRNYISVLDTKGYVETARLKTPGEPGPTAFSNNGRYAFVCSASGSRTMVFDVSKRSVVALPLESAPLCSGIATSPDGAQFWLTSIGAGRAFAYSAKPPFKLLRTFDTGPRPGSVNFVSTADGQFAYVAVAGLNAVKVFDTRKLTSVAYIPVGDSPAGVWPSGDGTRIYVGLGRDQAVAVVDTATMTVINTVKVANAVQAVVYVPNAVRSVGARPNLQPVFVTGPGLMVN